MKANLALLSAFITRASAATYAGGGVYETSPERPGFLELVFQEGDWHYRDSYTGFYRPAGMEVVRFQNQIVWTTCYGGGMEKSFESNAIETFDFLKQTMLAKPSDWQSFRGPNEFVEDDWKYTYTQQGDISAFSGYEEIYFRGQLYFTHRIVGGLIVGK